MSVKDWIAHENDIITHVLARLDDWRQTGYRPAQTFFTSGIERTFAQLIEMERNRYLRHAAELCAQHVDSHQTNLKSGFPPEVALDMISKTFRSEDWYRVLAGEVK